MSNCCARFGLAVAMLASVPVYAADGDLDATFGAAGKVQVGPSRYSEAVAQDTVIQPDGKIVVVGYDSDPVDGYDAWHLERLNADGSIDTNFANAHSGSVTVGNTGTRAAAVGLQPDGRIVVGGNYNNHIVIERYNADGSYDTTFAGGMLSVRIVPPAGDSNYVSRLVIEGNGTIDVAGTYYANQSGFNSNEFYFARISADGNTVEPFQYLFSSGPNADDHARDLAIDNQGRYVVVGYHRGASGNYDFAAIRIRSDLYDVDNTFGSGGQTTVDFGDNGDYANAVALTPTGYITLGGQANGQAALALLDPSGNVNQYFSGGLLYSDKSTFNFGTGGGNDTIAKLILDGYDTKYPQLLALGSGGQGGNPYGLMFGIARLNLPGTYSNFALDAAFNGNGTESVYFAKRPDGLGLLTTTNYALAGAFANGRLIATGYTVVAGGDSDIAVARLAAFDGIFKNGFDNPSL